jgi:hypothetical protein
MASIRSRAKPHFMKTLTSQLSQSESLAALAEQVEEDAIAITRLRSDMHLMRMINMRMRQNLSQGRLTPQCQGLRAGVGCR